VLADTAEDKVLILTTLEDDDYFFGALNAGAQATCSNAATRALLEAIHTLAADDSPLPLGHQDRDRTDGTATDTSANAT
jgi:DNA-binding NarL/FixJ family response regulator